MKPYKITILLFSLLSLFCFVERAMGQWTQWGGPNRNFVVETTGLADQWSETGPPRIWERDLGEGYSAILCENGVLYTLYRKANEFQNESVIALDANTGRTIWDTAYPSPPLSPDGKYPGPNAAPLLVGDRLYTFGQSGVLTCYRKTDGTVLWQKNLPEMLKAPAPGWGFSAGPIAYEQTVIVPIGCAMPYMRIPPFQTETYAPPSGQSLVALDQQNGEIVWKNLDFMMGHSSPILIRFEGREMLVLYTCSGVTGVDPANGRELWNYALVQDHPDAVINTPAWNGAGLLYLGAGNFGLVLKLSKEAEGFKVEELWRSSKVALGMSTPLVVDGLLIGSKRGNQPLIYGVDFTTGERTCYVRALPTATLVAGDGKIILLDAEGNLALATATQGEIVIRSQSQVMQRQSFTPPTLVGTRLYVRDTHKIMALELGTALTVK